VLIALASLAPACSSDGGASVDVEGELSAEPFFAEYVPRISGAPATPPSLDPQSVGASIAAAIDDLVALSDDDFRDAGGISRRDLADAVGSLMGMLATRLSELAADNGRQATVDTIAYALELGSAIASQSASGPSDDDRLVWLVPSAATLEVNIRTDLDHDLDADDFESVAERLVDEFDGFGPFDAINALESEFEQIVPADSAGYPRDDLRSAYRFVISLSEITASN
jgi:hypothetical protein